MKAIRLLMGLPRISHTAEAFLGFKHTPPQKIFNVIQFLFQKISETQILETEMIFIFLE